MSLQPRNIYFKSILSALIFLICSFQHILLQSPSNLTYGQFVFGPPRVPTSTDPRMSPSIYPIVPKSDKTEPAFVVGFLQNHLYRNQADNIPQTLQIQGYGVNPEVLPVTIKDQNYICILPQHRYPYLRFEKSNELNFDSAHFFQQIDSKKTISELKKLIYSISTNPNGNDYEQFVSNNYNHLRSHYQKLFFSNDPVNTSSNNTSGNNNNNNNNNYHLYHEPLTAAQKLAKIELLTQQFELSPTTSLNNDQYSWYIQSPLIDLSPTETLFQSKSIIPSNSQRALQQSQANTKTLPNVHIGGPSVDAKVGVGPTPGGYLHKTQLQPTIHNVLYSSSHTSPNSAMTTTPPEYEHYFEQNNNVFHQNLPVDLHNEPLLTQTRQNWYKNPFSQIDITSTFLPQNLISIPFTADFTHYNNDDHIDSLNPITTSLTNLISPTKPTPTRTPTHTQTHTPSQSLSNHLTINPFSSIQFPSLNYTYTTELPKALFPNPSTTPTPPQNGLTIDEVLNATPPNRQDIVINGQVFAQDEILIPIFDPKFELLGVIPDKVDVPLHVLINQLGKNGIRSDSNGENNGQIDLSSYLSQTNAIYQQFEVSDKKHVGGGYNNIGVLIHNNYNLIGLTSDYYLKKINTKDPLNRYQTPITKHHQYFIQRLIADMNDIPLDKIERFGDKNGIQNLPTIFNLLKKNSFSPQAKLIFFQLLQLFSTQITDSTINPHLGSKYQLNPNRLQQPQSIPPLYPMWSILRTIEPNDHKNDQKDGNNNNNHNNKINPNLPLFDDIIPNQTLIHQALSDYFSTLQKLLHNDDFSKTKKTPVSTLNTQKQPPPSSLSPSPAVPVTNLNSLNKPKLKTSPNNPLQPPFVDPIAPTSEQLLKLNKFELLQSYTNGTPPPIGSKTSTTASSSGGIDIVLKKLLNKKEIFKSEFDFNVLDFYQNSDKFIKLIQQLSERIKRLKIEQNFSQLESILLQDPVFESLFTERYDIQAENHDNIPDLTLNVGNNDENTHDTNKNEKMAQNVQNFDKTPPEQIFIQILHRLTYLYLPPHYQHSFLVQILGLKTYQQQKGYLQLELSLCDYELSPTLADSNNPFPILHIVPSLVYCYHPLSVYQHGSQFIPHNLDNTQNHTQNNQTPLQLTHYPISTPNPAIPDSNQSQRSKLIPKFSVGHLRTILEHYFPILPQSRGYYYPPQLQNHLKQPNSNLNNNHQRQLHFIPPPISIPTPLQHLEAAQLIDNLFGHFFSRYDYQHFNPYYKSTHLKSTPSHLSTIIDKMGINGNQIDLNQSTQLPCLPYTKAPNDWWMFQICPTHVLQFHAESILIGSQHHFEKYGPQRQQFSETPSVMNLSKNGLEIIKPVIVTPVQQIVPIPNPIGAGGQPQGNTMSAVVLGQQNQPIPFGNQPIMGHNDDKSLIYEVIKGGYDQNTLGMLIPTLFNQNNKQKNVQNNPKNSPKVIPKLTLEDRTENTFYNKQPIHTEPSPTNRLPAPILTSLARHIEIVAVSRTKKASAQWAVPDVITTSSSNPSHQLTPDQKQAQAVPKTNPPGTNQVSPLTSQSSTASNPSSGARTAKKATIDPKNAPGLADLSHNDPFFTMPAATYIHGENNNGQDSSLEHVVNNDRVVNHGKGRYFDPKSIAYGSNVISADDREKINEFLKLNRMEKNVEKNVEKKLNNDLPQPNEDIEYYFAYSLEHGDICTPTQQDERVVRGAGRENKPRTTLYRFFCDHKKYSKILESKKNLHNAFFTQYGPNNIISENISTQYYHPHKTLQQLLKSNQTIPKIEQFVFQSLDSILLPEHINLNAIDNTRPNAIDINTSNHVPFQSSKSVSKDSKEITHSAQVTQVHEVTPCAYTVDIITTAVCEFSLNQHLFSDFWKPVVERDLNTLKNPVKSTTSTSTTTKSAPAITTHHSQANPSQITPPQPQPQPQPATSETTPAELEKIRQYQQYSSIGSQFTVADSNGNFMSQDDVSFDLLLSHHPEDYFKQDPTRWQLHEIMCLPFDNAYGYDSNRNNQNSILSPTKIEQIEQIGTHHTQIEPKTMNDMTIDVLIEQAMAQASAYDLILNSLGQSEAMQTPVSYPFSNNGTLLEPENTPIIQTALDNNVLPLFSSLPMKNWHQKSNIDQNVKKIISKHITIDEMITKIFDTNQKSPH